MSRKGGAGGSANEGGSIHRNGTAAYLAVHALAGVPVNGVHTALPVRLHLEADTEVDDIVCTMQDNSTWYIQAKHTAGKNARLREAIAQWGRQSIEPTDRLVLASHTFRGLLRGLQPVIDRHAGGRGAPTSKSDQLRLSTLTQELHAGGVKYAKRMLKRVLLLQCAVDSGADSEQKYATALLAGTVVKPEHAAAAFEALRGYMQHTAHRREWTEARDWLAALNAANIPTLADPSASPGAALGAEVEAEKAYRRAHAGRLNQLDLTALHPALGMLDASTSLLDGWDVDVSSSSAGQGSQALIDVVRRNRRFVLSGQPGLGKSEALRQVAADVAMQPSAPLPLYIDVRSLLPSINGPEDITLDLLLRLASTNSPAAAPERLRSALQHAVTKGSALLLVDGLDEARGRSGIVAAGLARLLSELPESTGVILSTRPSALDATRQLGLPTVDLLPPRALAFSLERVVESLAAGVPSAERAAWTTTRIDSLRRHAESADEIWRVPLLASLATIRICETLSPPESAAELLCDVVLDAIRAWEKKRVLERDSFDRDLRSEMLQEGFVAIGHVLSTSGELSTLRAHEIVTEALKHWEFSAPLTKILAAQVIEYWDHHIGIFVDDGGKVIARSRQFAEVADAWMIASAAPDAQAEWLRTAVSDPDRQSSVRLATAQNASLRRGLLELGSRGADAENRYRAVAWIRRFWGDWTSCLDDLEFALEVIADAAEDTLPAAASQAGLIENSERGRRDTNADGWACVIDLVNAPLSDRFESMLVSRLDSLTLSGERRLLVNLILSLRLSLKEGTSLTPAQLSSVEALLFGTVPASHSAEWSVDGVLHFDVSEYFIPGVSDVIEAVAHRVDELPNATADDVYRFARHLPGMAYDRIDRTLRRKGHRDPAPFFQMSPAMKLFAEEYKDFHGFGWLLRHLSSGHSTDLDASSEEMWRASALSDFLFALGWHDTQWGELTEAKSLDASFLEAWFTAATYVTNLDTALIATQARRVLAAKESDPDPLRHVIRAPLTPLERERQLECGDTAETLAQGFSLTRWTARQAYVLLTNADCDRVSAAIGRHARPKEWMPMMQATLTALANTADRSEIIERAMTGNSAERAAVAAIGTQLGIDGVQARERLADDPNATVRFFAEAEPDGAIRWTCTWCWERCSIEELACPRCHQQSRWHRVRQASSE